MYCPEGCLAVGSQGPHHEDDASCCSSSCFGSSLHSKTLQLPGWHHCRRGSQAAGQFIKKVVFRSAVCFLAWFGRRKGLITQGIAKPLGILTKAERSPAKLRTVYSSQHRSNNNRFINPGGIIQTQIYISNYLLFIAGACF